jgi:hypothetical protein
MEIKEFVCTWILNNADNEDLNTREEIKKAIAAYHEIDKIIEEKVGDGDK